MPHEGCLRWKNFLESASGHAPGGTAEEVLGGRVPQDDPEVGIHADERVRQAAHQRLVVEPGRVH